MVSFWPFKGDDKSAAGFEKVLSTLSNKINKVSATDARLRQNQRRIRVLWTLYTCFAYVLAALILILVTGRENMNSIEWSGLAGGPVVIYGVRLTIDAYFNYRLSGTSASLSDLQKQREDAIEKLKAATKYNSTQQLLDKYGGSASPTPQPRKGQQQSPSVQQQQSPSQSRMQGRTGLPPPPTANIAKRPQQPALTQGSGGDGAQVQPTEEFAPNAFSAATRTSTGPATHPVTSAAPEYAPSGHSAPKWYDRILDVVLGEDETAPKNRIVLICEHCRLVNGQAPPGTRAVEDLGKWRCMGCGTMNGAESEVSRVVRQVRKGSDVRELDEDERKGGRVIGDETEDAAPEEDNDEDIDEAADGTPPAGSTRSKVRQRRK
ncbi:hypothetical protein MBLNU457_4937t1 [Dothideomycetes sp. NU457]